MCVTYDSFINNLLTYEVNRYVSLGMYTIYERRDTWEQVYIFTTSYLFIKYRILCYVILLLLSNQFKSFCLFIFYLFPSFDSRERPQSTVTENRTFKTHLQKPKNLSYMRVTLLIR